MNNNFLGDSHVANTHKVKTSTLKTTKCVKIMKLKSLNKTLDQNFGPKYIKQFMPSLVLSLSVEKLNFYENLVLCEWTELRKLNLLFSTSNPAIVLHINLQIRNLFTSFYFSTSVFFFLNRRFFEVKAGINKHTWFLFFSIQATNFKL